MAIVTRSGKVPTPKTIMIPVLLTLLGFLTGLLLGVHYGHTGIVSQYEARLAEAETRQGVLAMALSLATRDKFHAHQLKVEAQRQLYMKGRR